jgi:hypothetical protein
MFCHPTRPSLQDSAGACGPAHAAARDCWPCSPDDRADTVANSPDAPAPNAFQPAPDCPDNPHRWRACVAASAFCAHAGIRASNKTAVPGFVDAVKNNRRRLCISAALSSHRTSPASNHRCGLDRHALPRRSPTTGAQYRLRQMNNPMRFDLCDGGRCGKEEEGDHAPWSRGGAFFEQPFTEPQVGSFW